MLPDPTGIPVILDSHQKASPAAPGLDGSMSAALDRHKGGPCRQSVNANPLASLYHAGNLVTGFEPGIPTVGQTALRADGDRLGSSAKEFVPGPREDMRISPTRHKEIGCQCVNNG